MVEDKGEGVNAVWATEQDWIMTDETIDSIISLINSHPDIRQKIESMNDGVVILDQDYAVYMGNSRFSRMLGYENDELSKLHIWDWESSLSPEQVMKASKSILDKCVHFKSNLKKKDGSQVSVGINVKAFLNNNDQIWQICICRDLNQRKKIESDLIRSQRNLIETQKIAHIGTYEFNLKKNELWWSDELYRIYGLENKDLSSGKFLDYVHPDDRERLQKAQDDERDDYYIEYRIIRPDGDVRYLSTFVGKHEYRNGERYLIRGTSQDITKQKLIEQEKKDLELKLNHAQKMETVGTLAGGVAHDINNILGIIIGNTELCLDDVPEWSPAYPNLKEIEKAVHRAKDVVRQLLAFSRNIDIKKESIDIVSVINDALKFLRSTISATIEIEKDISVPRPNVFADPTQINQIILNICANSAQAMEGRGGVIKVRVENISVTHNPSGNTGDVLIAGDYIKIIISDNGPGIPTEIQDKIFNPYFTTKEVGKGSGMGLAVVEGIVNKHKGSINFKSQPGKGTSFTILLPGGDSVKKEKINSGQDASFKRSSILFIDDEVQITKVAGRMLESAGYRVEPSTDPGRALKMLNENPDDYDLVITDMAMPRMNALMLFKEIRKVRPDIPVILSSGHNPLVDDEKAKETGFAAYILKPFTKSELVSAVKSVFENQSG